MGNSLRKENEYIKAWLIVHNIDKIKYRMLSCFFNNNDKTYSLIVSIPVDKKIISKLSNDPNIINFQLE